MPRHYPPADKAAALKLLASTGGDILFVHTQTGIPERTLYAWRRALWLQQAMQQHTNDILSQIASLSPQLQRDYEKPESNPGSLPPRYEVERATRTGTNIPCGSGDEDVLPNPAYEIPKFKNDLEALQFLRQQIVSELVAITTSFKGDLRVTSPYQRAAVLSQLLDRLMKLDKHLQPLLRDAERRHTRGG